VFQAEFTLVGHTTNSFHAACHIDGQELVFISSDLH